MYFYFGVNRDDYLTHYHRRSSVESALSMIKRKFGDGLRGKNDTSMRNEAPAKILCHNLCCVIGTWYELGIEPGEWMPRIAGRRNHPNPPRGRATCCGSPPGDAALPLRRLLAILRRTVARPNQENADGQRNHD